eukprot:765754-Hanusia_phi.AAC.1
MEHKRYLPLDDDASGDMLVGCCSNNPPCSFDSPAGRQSSSCRAICHRDCKTSRSEEEGEVRKAQGIDDSKSNVVLDRLYRQQTSWTTRWTLTALKRIGC